MLACSDYMFFSQGPLNANIQIYISLSPFGDNMELDEKSKIFIEGKNKYFQQLSDAMIYAANEILGGEESVSITQKIVVFKRGSEVGKKKVVVV